MPHRKEKPTKNNFLMENNLFGVIIKVKNIDLCRSFYRDVLNLGEPVMDSNFWVEFEAGDNFVLALEKSAARFLEHEPSATAWICRVDDVSATQKRLNKHGFKTSISKSLKMGETLYRCQDPENNVFYIFSDDAHTEVSLQRDSTTPDNTLSKTNRLNEK
ncbi:MAG: VOC family protein [Lentisphaerae bacterium]|nr:VOC family protein [Lentisphaerota bacterium]MCP4103523.1 VOC family protein [Lentisphaerota bacterium]